MKAVAEAAAYFPVQGDILSIDHHGTGHIHDTFRLRTTEHAYLLQRLNTSVFQQPEKIFANQRLLKPLIERGLIVAPIPAEHGELGLCHAGHHWRMQHFIEEVYGPTQVESEKVAFEVAKGFALFNKACLTLNPDNFQEVIPDFHRLGWRMQQFAQACQGADSERLDFASAFIEQVKTFSWINQRMNDLWAQGLPQRVCHNDTKADNVLLNMGSHEFRYVIDLDTVGPGTLLYDFGDLMRTVLSPTGESEPDVTKIKLNTDYFSALAQAYRQVLWEEISAIERSSLVFGGLYMTYMMAVRFLTDYLNGDIYYKISFETENWVRARNQLVLLKELNEHQAQLNETLRK